LALTDCPPFEEALGFPPGDVNADVELLRHEIAAAALSPTVHRAAQQALDETERELIGGHPNRARVFERLQGLVRLLHASGALVRGGPDLVRPIQRLIALA
jgi:hypothetical protein